MSGYYGKTDESQAGIARALRDAGLPVRSTHTLGDGFSDLITRHVQGHIVLIECKTGKGKTSRATRMRQEAFAAVWPVFRCTTPEEALRVVGVLRP